MILPYGHIEETTGIKRLIKRAIRRLLRWLLAPLYDEVNRQAAALDTAQQQLTQHATALDTAQQQLTQQAAALDTAHRQLTQQAAALDTAQRQITDHAAALDTAQQQLTQQAAALDTAQQQLTQHAAALDAAQQHGQALRKALEEGTWFPKEASGSASQAGEDRILSHIFSTLGIPDRARSYLDLGANHAVALSNTYAFYQGGACGVLVEANPALIPELEQMRPDDIVLNRCVCAEADAEMEFYILSGDGLSTPDRAQAEAALKENPALTIERTVTVKSISANELMDTYFNGSAPAILNLDIEGNELEILKSIDFEKHRPLIIVLETIPYRKGLVVGEKERESIAFLASKGYVEYAFTGINSILLDTRKVTVVDGAAVAYHDICGGAENLTYKMHSTDNAQRIFGLQAASGEVIFGPYLTLLGGTHRFLLDVELPDGVDELSCQVTADSGETQIAEFMLHNGENPYELVLGKREQSLEFVIRNTLPEGSVLLKRLEMIQ